jgi:hypothetical protein
MSHKNKTEVFDHFSFRGEKIEAPLAKNPGISYIWYWDQEKGMYVPPTPPIKPDRAVRTNFPYFQLNHKTTRAYSMALTEVSRT